MPVCSLSILENYCTGTAESESSFFDNIFVEPSTYQEIVTSFLHSPTILMGRKGTGKTALLKYIESKSKKSDLYHLYLKPDDVPLLGGIENASELSTIKRKSFESLICAITTKIGKDLKGLLSRKDKKLFDRAVISGDRDPDFIQVCSKTLASFGSVITNRKIETLLPKVEESTSTALLRSLHSRMEKEKKVFFLLLDDIDQIASLEKPDHINRIWGFILAAKKLTEEMPYLKAIISLRTEVWSMLAKDPMGQRDQIDHVRQLIIRIDPDDKQIKRILKQRLYWVQQSCGQQGGDPREFFFEGDELTLPWNGETRAWMDFIAKNSRRRPRDAIQFLAILSKHSALKGKEKICNEAVQPATDQYSNERVNDLVREYERECPNIREVVNSFADLEYVSSTEDVRNHLSTISSKCSLSIHGKSLDTQDNDQLFILWQFLFRTGFINPKIPDNTAPRNFRHLSHDSEPNFVSQGNWNEMQKVAWEIHPAYRSHIAHLKTRDRKREGISLTSFFTKKKKKRG